MSTEGNPPPGSGLPVVAVLFDSLGNRVGFENILRFLPAESHIPERAYLIAPAAHSAPGDWSAGAATPAAANE